MMKLRMFDALQTKRECEGLIAVKQKVATYNS